jgi:hypothetical protein
MSSSNLVRLAFIEESTLGDTPGIGNFSTARFTSESLSGSPQTTESQQIRTDRLSSGQIVTGLEVGGDINFELAREAALDLFIASAMLNAWNTQALQTVDIDLDATAKTLERASGDWAVTLSVGDFITLAGFTNTENNTQAQVLEIVSALIIRCSFNVTGGALVTESGTGTTYKRADKITIGTTKKSFSIEKSFLDLTTKALIYKGMMVDQMNLNVAYGEIITGSFKVAGTDYVNADSAGEFITNARTITAPSTTNSLNGSIDMPFINSSVLGDLEEVDFCIQSLSLALSNNLQAQNCIGESAPNDYSPGTANIEVNLSAYLADDNWEIIAKKLTQESFAIGFMVKNLDGWYGFYLPAVQVTFDDPSSGGANQDISLEMSGVAKVGSNGEKSLTIYRS